MGFLKTNVDDIQMQIYLTEYGKKRMLERHFNPTHFSMNDSDVNYNDALTVISKKVVDASGDYNDNIFSLSKFANIKGSIIRSKETPMTMLEGVEELTEPLINQQQSTL